MRVRNKFRKWLGTALVGLLITALTASPAAAAPEPPAIGGDRCQQLAQLSLTDTRIERATLVPAGGFTPPRAAEPLDLPAFCRVSAGTSWKKAMSLGFEPGQPPSI